MIFEFVQIHFSMVARQNSPGGKIPVKTIAMKSLIWNWNLILHIDWRTTHKVIHLTRHSSRQGLFLRSSNFFWPFLLQCVCFGNAIFVSVQHRTSRLSMRNCLQSHNIINLMWLIFTGSLILFFNWNILEKYDHLVKDRLSSSEASSQIYKSWIPAWNYLQIRVCIAK